MRVEKNIKTLFFLLITFFSINKLYSAEVIYDRTQQIGLSFLYVSDIVKDDKGFMWFATTKGLNRWDGYQFKYFYHEDNNNNSLSSNYVNAVLFDKKGILWIATSNGLNSYDPKSGKFKHHYNITDEKNKIPSNYIYSMAEDSVGNIWLGTEYGLKYFDIQTAKFYNYDFTEFINLPELNYKVIRKVFFDSEDNLWMSFSYSGLLKYNTKTKEKKFYLFDSDNNYIPSLNDFLILDNEKILIGTWGNKALVYSKLNDSFSPWEGNKYFESKVITNIKKDKNGDIWIADYFNQIIHFSSDLKVLERYKVTSESHNIPSNQVKCFYAENDNIWVGTMNQGFFRFNISPKIVKNLFEEDPKLNELSRVQVLSMTKGKPHEIIIGTSNHKIFIYNDKTKELKTINTEEDNIYRVYFDEKNNKILYGTYLNKLKSIDLNSFKTNNEISFPFASAVHGIASNDSLIFVTPWAQGLIATNIYGKNIVKVTEDWQRDFSTLHLLHDGDMIWLATFKNGVVTYNIKTNEMKSHLLTDQSNEKFLSNQVDIITKLHNGDILICTNEDGVCSIKKNNFTIRKVGKNIGLDKLHIKSIFEDSENNIWIITEQKIIKTDTNFNNYTEITFYDGLFSGIEHLASCYLKESNKIFIGGQQGVQYFKPFDTVANNSLNNVVITDLRIFEKQIENEEKILNGKTISYCDTIRLNHNMNFITIDFSSMNYYSQTVREFSYKLSGLNNEWITVPFYKNSITYSNLSPGEYDFKIKVSNDHGMWSDNETRLHISILPPFWKTSLFRFLIIAFVVSAILIYNRLKDYNYMQEKKKLEAIVKERTSEVTSQKEELENANEVKNKFFNIIAHDLKNPVSSVVQLTELMKDNFDSYTKEKQNEIIESIANSANSTLFLLEDLLVWARSQINKITFSFEPQNIYDLAQSEIINHYQQAINKNISLINELENGTFVMADSSSIKTVFRNLISNAIKFSKSEGAIIIGGITENDNYIVFVKDFGIGMTNKTLEKLFKLSEKQSIDGTNGEKGSGLGLNICKEFVEKNHGKIWVESEPETGSTFYFSLPLLK